MLKQSTIHFLEAFAQLSDEEQFKLIGPLGGDSLFEAMIDSMMDNLEYFAEQGKFEDVTSQEQAAEALRKIM
jgi:hypothetical protein